MQHRIDLDSIRDPRRRDQRWRESQIEFVAEKVLDSLRYHVGDVLPYDSTIALELCGYRVVEDESLGTFVGESGLREIAGIIDAKN